jgi:dihydrofolate synthase/folylpolyglutamate synthase
MPISLDHESLSRRSGRTDRRRKGGHHQARRPGDRRRAGGDAARDVLVETAERLRAPLCGLRSGFIAFEENGRLIYQDEAGLMDLTPPRLPGRHQFANAAAAIAAVRAAGFDIGHEAAERR